MRRINVFDTTLRDGEQSPGAALGVEKKVEFALQLARLNVDVIEAGFPVASSADFDAVRQISLEIKDQTVCAFARSLEKDISAAASALRGAHFSRIQIVTPISDGHIATRLRIDRKRCLDMIRESIAFAADCADEVAFIGEDSSRSDPDFRIKCFEAALEAGARVLTYADTVGYATPEDISQDIGGLIENLTGSNSIIGIHCHDDLGLAVANSLSAISAGAGEVQCTINGIGERAGNAALEEVVMALSVREEHYRAKTQVDTRLLTLTSGLLEKFTGINVPANKAIVGKNAFAHCSGMHQHGILMHPQNYEIVSPDVVGAHGREIVLGRHSGKHGVRHVLSEMGYQVGESALNCVMDTIKTSLSEGEYINKNKLRIVFEECSSMERHT